jgi:tetratricopeptide (TPR) repeat protein
MRARGWLHNCIVAALGRGLLAASLLLAALLVHAAPATAQTPELDALFERLQTAEAGEASRIEREIANEWSKSGSAAMDLLLQRGREALSEGETATAIDHFTALIDHAPDFAEGWNARATAYFQAGDYGPSVADIGRTLTLNPRHFGALSGLGMIFEQLDQPERALEVYRAALAIHPQMAAVREAVTRLETEVSGQDL